MTHYNRITTLASNHIVIFDLPAVVSYDHLPLRKALISAISEVTGKPPALQDIDWSKNSRGVLYKIFRATFGNLPSKAETKAIKEAFHHQLKEYFLNHEDPFDVWPGVQNIFESLDRREDWDYLIISDYWSESTRFILNSCGIFSGKLKLLTAEDGLSAHEIVHEIGQNHQQCGEEVLYLLARDIPMEEGVPTDFHWERIPPPKRARANLLEYPRFSKLFATSQV